MKHLKVVSGFLVFFILMLLVAPAMAQRTGGSFGASNWGAGRSSSSSSYSRPSSSSSWSRPSISWSRPSAVSTYRSGPTTTRRSSSGGIILIHSTGSGTHSEDHHHYYHDGGSGESIDPDAFGYVCGFIFLVAMVVIGMVWWDNRKSYRRRW